MAGMYGEGGDHRLVLREIRVAFFRNLNLGHTARNSPTSGQLLDAFVEAGARSPSHIGANGTVAYYYPAGPTLARRVVSLLTPVCGYRDLVVVRSGVWLLGLDRRLDGLTDGEVVLYDTRPGLVVEPPIETDDGLVIGWLDHRAAIASHRPGIRPTAAGPFVADLVGAPTTTRTIGTMRRVVERVREYG